MTNIAQSAVPSEDFADDLPVESFGTESARPIPRISIQAFCEDQQLANVLQHAAEDRRLSKAHVSVHMGGATAAVSHYQESPTPTLIVIQCSLPKIQKVREVFKDQLKSTTQPAK